MGPVVSVATPAIAAATSATLPAGAPSSPATSGAAMITTATGDAAPAATQPDSPRNAPPAVEPTPGQWAHLFAIRAQLSPRDAAIAQTVVTRMAPEMRAQWLAELSALSVDEAAEVVRSMIPKPPPKPPRVKNGPRDGEG